MPTATTRLALDKPTIGGDTDQWGSYLNAALDTLDQAVVQNYGALQTFDAQIGFDDGTLANPGWAFASDLNTGIRRSAADVMHLVTGGVDAVTVDASQRVGIGTTSPVHAFQVGDSGGVIALGGTPTTNATGRLKFINSDTQKNWQVSSNDFLSGAFEIAQSTAAGGSVFSASTVKITSALSVVLSGGALATTATDGFTYLPTCAGTPTGTPTTQTGTVPAVVDSTNNKLYFHSGGAWRDAGP